MGNYYMSIIVADTLYLKLLICHKIATRNYFPCTYEVSVHNMPKAALLVR